MIVTDPVYEGKEMIDWSEGVLPVSYYLKALSLIGPQDLKVTISDSFRNPGRVVAPEEYESLEIAPGGMATIGFNINGVDLTLHLLAEDMTKFNPSRYHVLGLGRPTPTTDKIFDPRYSDTFQTGATQNLAVDGIIEYDEGNFNFVPKELPAEVFGFKEVYSKDGRKVVQKKEDVGNDKLNKAFKAIEAIHEGVGALAGDIPGKNWIGYYKNVARYSDSGEEATIDEVVDAYGERLDLISDFINSISDVELRKQALKRVEFLFMNPIASNGQIDNDKVLKIHEVPSDPDQTKNGDQGSSHGPYFGEVNGLINDHNAGNVDIFEYYKRLISEFYNRFAKTPDF